MQNTAAVTRNFEDRALPIPVTWPSFNPGPLLQNLIHAEGDFFRFITLTLVLAPFHQAK